MTIRRFDRSALDSEPHQVRFKDIYPWDAIARTPFGASLAVVEPGGMTMLHAHAAAETFVICRGSGMMTIEGQSSEVGPGDVVYLRPHSLHQLANPSTSEELHFVSVFWSPPPPKEEVRPLFIMPSPPTSNGPLHLGHLGGPYLIADVARRHYRMKGVPAVFACLADEHQSYVVRRAEIEESEPATTAERYSDACVEAFRAFGAEPDAFVFPTRDPEYRSGVEASFRRLLATGLLEERESDGLYCETCRRALYDGFVQGACPSCDAPSNGFACQFCCLPNETIDLREPVCTRCKRTPSLVRTRRWVFPLAPFVEQLQLHHARLPLSPKLRGLAARILSVPSLAPPASQPGSWGISVGDGQVISPWFEVALALPHLLGRLAPKSEVMSSFGIDNAYLYLIHDPAVCLALGEASAIPTRLAVNEFLLLEDEKMSTTGGHALGAREVLEQVPAEALRLYLAMTRAEEAPESVSLEHAKGFASSLGRHWRGWLERLGRALVQEAEAKVPEAVEWSPEQSRFLAEVKLFGARARRGYDELSLREVAAVILELAERAHAFGLSQAHLAEIPTLRSHRATGLAVELAAVRTLAVMVAPLMPSFAARLWEALGCGGEPRWSDDLELLPAGQPLALEALAARPILFEER